MEKFFRYFPERANLAQDLHFITHSGSDTLDYSGGALHEGAKLLWTATEPAVRELGLDLSGDMPLPAGFENPVLALPGVIVVEGRPNRLPREQRELEIENILCSALATWPNAENFPLFVIVDDSAFAGRSLANFLWTTFTRSAPSMDIYGIKAGFKGKHWYCGLPLVIDARLKSYQTAALEDDPQIIKKIENLAGPGGPLHGLF